MPAIWLIDAYRAGERRQVHALASEAADALGWTCETLQLGYREAVFWPHLLRQASLAGVRRADRRRLIAPWPALVITAGVRNEPVGRWLRRASGGQARYVHVGRPWGRLEEFDLLVTTPQYRVPAHPRILHNDLTLHDLTAQGLARNAEVWNGRFAGLPRPWIGVLVGGDSGPYTLGPRAADRLLDQAMDAARRSGGSLLVVTSARTAPAVNARLQRRLGRGRSDTLCPHFLQCWGAEGDNAYPGILALADTFIVTADSIAMLSEACATGRPVHMFDCGGMRRDADRRGGPGKAPGVPEAAGLDWRLGGDLYALLMRHCPDSWSRDISLVHAALESSGRAHWLRADTAIHTAVGSPAEGELASPDMQRALARIVRLVGA